MYGNVILKKQNVFCFFFSKNVQEKDVLYLKSNLPEKQEGIAVIVNNKKRPTYFLCRP